MKEIRAEEEKLFQANLMKHLKKCEIEFCAQQPGGHCIDWLDCDSVKHIAAQLKELGFRIRRIVDEEPWPGELHQWVETTSGVIVFANTPYTKGFVAKAT